MLRVRMVSASGCRMCRGPSRGLAQSSCTPLRRGIDRDGRLAMDDGRTGARCDAWDAVRGCRVPVVGVVVVVVVAVMLRCTCTCTCKWIAPEPALAAQWQQIPAKIGQALNASALARESKAKTKLTPTSTQHLFSFLQRLKPPLLDCTVPSTERQQSCLSERSTATA